MDENLYFFKLGVFEKYQTVFCVCVYVNFLFIIFWLWTQCNEM